MRSHVVARERVKTQAKPKAKEFKNKPIPNYDKLVELYGKDRETGKQTKIVVNVHGIFFLCILDFMLFCFSMFYLRATLCFADKCGLVYTIKTSTGIVIIQTYE